jgi:hypothetical protein
MSIMIVGTVSIMLTVPVAMSVLLDEDRELVHYLVEVS